MFRESKVANWIGRIDSRQGLGSSKDAICTTYPLVDSTVSENGQGEG